MNYSRIASIVAVALIVVPVFSSALTADELNSQIAALISQVAALQKQLIALPQAQPSVPTTTVATSTSAQSPSSVSTPSMFACPLFTRSLGMGSRGDDVFTLQQFLIGQKLLTADSATGFFGAMTQAAVQNWQSSRGVVTSGDPSTTGFGVVGARTRGLIALNCQPSPMTPVTTTSTTTGPIACTVANPPLSNCSTGWKPIKDQSGCTVAYDCATPLPTVATSTQNRCPLYSLPVCTTGSTLQSSGIDYGGCPLPLKCAPPNNTSPYISVNVPTTGAQGSAVTITWNSWNAPANSAVVLSTVSSGRISQGLSTSGTYSWTIPGANCDNGNPPFCWFMVDNPNVWGTTVGQTLQISAQLYTPADASLGIASFTPSSNLVYVAKSSPMPLTITAGDSGYACIAVAYPQLSCPVGQHSEYSRSSNGCPAPSVCVPDAN